MTARISKEGAKNLIAEQVRDLSALTVSADDARVNAHLIGLGLAPGSVPAVLANQLPAALALPTHREALAYVATDAAGRPAYVIAEEDGRLLHPSSADRARWCVPFNSGALSSAVNLQVPLRLVTSPIACLQSERHPEFGLPSIAMLEPLALDAKFRDPGRAWTLEENLFWMLPRLRLLPGVKLCPDASTPPASCDRLVVWLRSMGVKATRDCLPTPAPTISLPHEDPHHAEPPSSLRAPAASPTGAIPAGAAGHDPLGGSGADRGAGEHQPGPGAGAVPPRALPDAASQPARIEPAVGVVPGGAGEVRAEEAGTPRAGGEPGVGDRDGAHGRAAAGSGERSAGGGAGVGTGADAGAERGGEHDAAPAGGAASALSAIGWAPEVLVPVETAPRPELPHALVVVKPGASFADAVSRLGAAGVSCSFVGRAQALRNVEQKGSLEAGSLVFLCQPNGLLMGHALWAGTGRGEGSQSQTYFIGCHPGTAREAEPGHLLDLSFLNGQKSIPLLIGPDVRRKNSLAISEEEHAAYAAVRRGLWSSARSGCGFGPARELVELQVTPAEPTTIEQATTTTAAAPAAEPVPLEQTEPRAEAESPVVAITAAPVNETEPVAATNPGDAATTEAVDAVEQATPPTDSRVNFIARHDAEVIPPSGQKSRFQANVAAIELLRVLEVAERPATPEEQRVLAQFSGWGALPQAFVDQEDYENEWTSERKLLRSILSPVEWEEARESTPFAHFTDPATIHGMWAIARTAGFTGGRVLESTAGNGRFLALMPNDLAAKSSLVGYEKDLVTGGILKALFPAGDMQVAPFESCTYPTGYFDLAITNVPFADVAITSDDRFRNLRPMLHDYCILRTMDLVRPGGIGIFLTSTGTMDKASPRVREELYRHSDLMTAFRLPAGSQGTAGTTVVCDLLILRRRLVGESKKSDLWIRSEPWPEDHQVHINRLFRRKPELVLGELSLGRSRMYGGRSVLNVVAQDDFGSRWDRALASIPTGIMSSREMNDSDVARLARVNGQPTSEGRRFGQLVITDGKLWQSCGGNVPMMEIAPILTGDASLDARRTTAHHKRIAIVGDYIELRGAATDLLAAQVSEASEGMLEGLREALGASYDQFVRRHGYLHKRTVVSAIEGDPDASLVLALESWNGEKATKSTIFTENTTNPQARSQVGASPDPVSAVAVSLNQKGYLDLAIVSELLGTDEKEACNRLRAARVAFCDPARGWVPADEYLSGDIRQKLTAAEAALRDDPTFQVNAEALRAVMPKQLGYDEIYVTLGSTWVGPDHLTKFAAHLLGGQPEQFAIDYNDSIGEWVVNYSHRGSSLRYSDQAMAIWGTPGANFIDLLEAGILRRPMVVYVPGAGDEERIVDRDATEAAANKSQEIEERFRDWLWEDPDRRQLLVERYNVLFNSTVPRAYDGSHLTFPGMSKPGMWANGVNFGGLRSVQKDGVWQIVTRGNALLGHDVGVGKSMTMIASAMELRRLGLAKKPAIALLKSTCVDFEAEARRLYPGARILSASGEFDAKSRRETVARIATGDWDLILLTHDQLQRIPISPGYQMEYFAEEMAQYDDLLRNAGQDPNNVSRKATRQVKQIAKARLRLRQKIADAQRAAAEESTVTFEETGIDFLFVDEAHKFKSLPIKTQMGDVKGIPVGNSDRAMNMHMLACYLRAKNQGRGLVFATATPVVNTLCEVFVMQTFIQPLELKRRKIHHFDGWAAAFGEATSRMEFTHTGEYKPTVRFTQFVNLPELQQIAFQDFSIVRAEDVGAICRPNRTDVPVELEPGEAQLTFMRSLQFRAKRLEEYGRKMDLSKDNHLLLATDGRLCATDLRLAAAPGTCPVTLLEEETKDEHRAILSSYTIRYDDTDMSGSKAVALVSKITEVLAAHPGTTQLVFTEINHSNRTGFSVLNDIIDQLQNAGIPRERIEIFHDLSDMQRYRAAQRLNEGTSLIGIGNTMTLGTGVNCQRLLRAIHHLDAPWTPSAMVQRNGRGWRQGNTNTELSVYTYLTKRTLDAWLYQTLGRKDRFIRGFMDKSSSERSVVDQDVETMSYDQLMAIASGNPLLYERINTINDVDRLSRAKQRHAMTEMQNRNLFARQAGIHRELIRKAMDLDEDAKFYSESNGVDVGYEHPDGREVRDRDEAAKELRRELLTARKGQEKGMGKYHGFFIYGQLVEGLRNHFLSVNIRRTPTSRPYTLEIGLEDGLLDAGMDVLNSTGRMLGNLAHQHRTAVREVAQLEVSMAKVKEELGRPFRQASDLARKQLMLSLIDAALTDGRSCLTEQEIGRLRVLGDAEKAQ